MKILAFSDLHGNESAMKTLAKKAKKTDIVICAGDFTVFENKILKVMHWMDTLGKPVIIVNGNHEDEILVKEICKKLKNVYLIHRKIHHDKNYPEYAFVGHGGEGFAHVSEDFEKFAKSKMPKKKIIFITHQPPHNTKLDYIWAHHGSKSYARYVKKVQPELHICGHLHETQGIRDKIGKTIIMNPGPKGEIVEVA